MSDKLNMEQLMRTRLDGAELSPSPESWKTIQRKLRWKQFLRFNPGRVNIYYAGALLLAATGLVLLLAGERGQAEQAVSEDVALQPSQIVNTVEDSGGESIQEANLENRHGEIQSESPASLSQRRDTAPRYGAQPCRSPSRCPSWSRRSTPTARSSRRGCANGSSRSG